LTIAAARLIEKVHRLLETGGSLEEWDREALGLNPRDMLGQLLAVHGAADRAHSVLEVIAS
jgi:hypothetical protein